MSGQTVLPLIILAFNFCLIIFAYSHLIYRYDTPLCILGRISIVSHCRSALQAGIFIYLWLILAPSQARDSRSNLQPEHFKLALHARVALRLVHIRPSSYHRFPLRNQSNMAAVNKTAHPFDKTRLEALLNRRFFYAPAFEIYGGMLSL